MSINLMPWREERRKKYQKDFMTKMGLSALAAVVVLVVAGAGLSAVVAGQNARNAFLEKEIAQAEKEIEEIKTLEAQKEQLLGRRNVIERLDASRDQLARAFHEIANKSTENVTLTAIEHKANILEVQGLASSNSAVAKFSESLDQSDWFDKTEIVIIQNREVMGQSSSKPAGPAGSTMNYAFVIKTSLLNPNAPQEEEVEAADSKKEDRRR